MSFTVSQEEDLIFQSYFTFCLLAELKNNDFTNSDYYDLMAFADPIVKKQIHDLGVDNQGCLLMCLYAMIVVPKQFLENLHSNEFNKIQEFLAANMANTTTTYNSDQPTVDYLRHIRNAVAHARVSLRPSDVVIFQDINSNSSFSTELSLQKVGEFIHRLQMVHVKHIQDRQREQLRERHSI
jgi:HEPN pEK499 p136